MLLHKEWLTKLEYLLVDLSSANNKDNINKGRLISPLLISQFKMSANFHPLVYIIDYILGIVMWTLIGRVAMNIFQREDSEFFFMKVFVKFTNPLIKLFKPLTPSFIIGPLVPLYVAWFFFMIRFYLMPWILGYSVMGMLSFPLESEISRQIYQFFNSIKF